MNIIIKLKKIDNQKIKSLKNELLNYADYKNSVVLNQDRMSNNFLSELLLVDISQILFSKFDTKLQRVSGKNMNLDLRINEAIVLLEVCNFKNPFRDEFTTTAMIFISNLIMQEIINL